MLDQIKDILEEKLGVDRDDITLETSFKDDLGADSLDLFELVMALEDEYGISFDENELEKLNTVGDAIEFLSSKGIA